MTKPPVRIAITGAAGQITYSLLFRVAAGDLLGPDQPVILQLLEVTPAMKALQGVVMELQDCAFPTLAGIEISDDPNKAFAKADLAFLVGAKPRGKGMERKDLLRDNGGIFSVQGKALNDVAARHVKVLVVGNPANTNCYIALNNAPDLDPRNFSAMVRLDQNRAAAQIASKTGRAVSDVKKVTIWGNHSNTQYPDAYHAEIEGKSAAEVINDQAWIENQFIPAVQERGKAIIEARGLSSAASAASAAIDHMRDWVFGSPKNDWVSMGVRSDGSYGIAKGLISGFPCICEDGQWRVIKGLQIDEFSRKRIDLSVAELQEEAAAVSELIEK